jgi:hypothetical protein
MRPTEIVMDTFESRRIKRPQVTRLVDRNQVSGSLPSVDTKVHGDPATASHASCDPGADRAAFPARVATA